MANSIVSSLMIMMRTEIDIILLLLNNQEYIE